jgi:hypothetical protein
MKNVLILVVLFSVVSSCFMLVTFVGDDDYVNSSRYISRGIGKAIQQ